MPLSPPARRAPIHNRTIVCDGYRREDGLWDIEGRLVDTKGYTFENGWRGEIEPGAAVHEMLVRLTIDDKFTVVAVECATDNSPYPACGAIVPNFQRLVGQNMGAGWTKQVKSLVGAAEGCTHHVELFRLLGTVAFQTIVPLMARQRQAAQNREGARRMTNTCHIWREGGELMTQFQAGLDKVP